MLTVEATARAEAAVMAAEGAEGEDKAGAGSQEGAAPVTATATEAETLGWEQAAATAAPAVLVAPGPVRPSRQCCRSQPRSHCSRQRARFARR